MLWCSLTPISVCFPLPGPEDDDLDTELRHDAVSSYLELLQKPRLAEILVCQICWVSGRGGAVGGAVGGVECCDGAGVICVQSTFYGPYVAKCSRLNIFQN